MGNQKITLNRKIPLTPDSHHLAGAATLPKMKRGVMIINTSRGALVDAAALIEALKSGQVGAVGLDVYEREAEFFYEDLSDQIVQDDVLQRLLSFPNVIIVSHQAFFHRNGVAQHRRDDRPESYRFRRRPDRPERSPRGKRVRALKAAYAACHPRHAGGH